MVWKKLWNRFLDGGTMKDEVRKDLLKIENKIFNNIKPDVEKETHPWTGSQEQNFIADHAVAKAVSKAFETYERGLKRKGTYFTFRRFKKQK